MKISKLFHWLYAILMLLPFAFFVPSVLYYAFNDNATMQSVEVPKTETIAVNFNQQRLEFNSVVSSIAANNNNVSLSIDYTFTGRTLICNTNRISTYVNHKYAVTSVTNLNYLLIHKANWSCNFTGEVNIFTATSDDDYGFNIEVLSNSYPVTIQDTINVNIFDLTLMFGVGNEPTIEEFKQMFPLEYYPYTESELMQITYDTGETEQLVENTSIINYAWESIWDLPLFSWCKVSFVATPFTYITGLFGLAASNSFNYVFTYFASMSIIWLVFDVIMYVPLLVHRWLDKGIVE